jgi:hypothetical protein
LVVEDRTQRDVQQRATAIELIEWKVSGWLMRRD